MCLIALRSACNVSSMSADKPRQCQHASAYRNLGSLTRCDNRRSSAPATAKQYQRSAHVAVVVTETFVLTRNEKQGQNLYLSKYAVTANTLFRNALFQKSATYRLMPAL